MASQSRQKTRKPRGGTGKLQYATPQPPVGPRVSTSRLVWTLVLLNIGAGLWWLSGNDIPLLRCNIVLATVAITIVPGFSGKLTSALERMRQLSPPARWKLALGLGAIASIYLAATAFIQGRDLFPKMEDECSYVLGAQMLAHGRLWMQAHPLQDFFETFWVIVKPVYCSCYFPGTALLFAPMFWLHTPYWLLPVVVSGGIVAMLARIVAELVDGTAAILSAIWMISLGMFRGLSTMVISHPAMLLFGLLMLWAWLRWQQSRRVGWALLIGAFAGWAATTRPADALAYAIPIGVAVLLGLRDQPLTRWLQTGLAILAGAAPFLMLQIVFNLGVTGHALETPYTHLLKAEQPGVAFGFPAFNPSAKANSALPQKQAYYEWCKPFLKDHHPFESVARLFLPRGAGGGNDDPRLLIVANADLPSRALLLLFPLGLMALSDRKRIVVAATLPVFFFVYLFHAFFFEHYSLVIVPPVVLVILLGYRALADLWPAAGVAVAVAILMLSLTSLWEVKQIFPQPLNQPPQDGMLESAPIGVIDRELIPSKVRPPAVVLFKPMTDFFEDPVYNLGPGSIDDQLIIRARDLGPRDIEIVRYYAQHQPERMFYLCDPDNLGISRLGTASELLAQFDRAPQK
jgi:4-amino-4-deoxy-L-arabinose transferase-like glycosyltransferase